MAICSAPEVNDHLFLCEGSVMEPVAEGVYLRTWPQAIAGAGGATMPSCDGRGIATIHLH